MKNTIYITLFFIIACKQNTTAGFEVNGTVKNSPAKTIYLEETTFTSPQPVIVDSATLSTNGSFRLHTIPKEETIYNLRLSKNEYPFVSLVNDTKTITVTADLNNANQELYTVKGSPASEALKGYLFSIGIKMRSIYNNNQLIDSLSQKKVSDTLLSRYTAERDASAKSYKEYTTNFINTSNSAALILFVLGSYQGIAGNPAFKLPGYSLPEVNDIINKTAARFPANISIAAIKTSLQQQQNPATATATLLNKPAPGFTLPDVNNKPVALSSFKGKYVLVDFWASWCPPCRAENPNVVKAYNEFKNKNFTVLGVSLDRPGQKDAWLKAIKEDNLTWTHVSDLKFWNSQVVSLYGFDGIPYNVLIDPNGVVIGESLRGEELENKLRAVLK